MFRVYRGAVRTPRPTFIVTYLFGLISEPRRNSYRRTTYPLPLFHPVAQTFANRVHENVICLFNFCVMISKPVIEEISLP